jgi:hypothetical protein
MTRTLDDGVIFWASAGEGEKFPLFTILEFHETSVMLTHRAGNDRQNPSAAGSFLANNLTSDSRHVVIL